MDLSSTHTDPSAAHHPPHQPQQHRLHWPLLLVLGLASILLFTQLGRDHLWADEGDTAVLAGSILKYGVPTAWDGVNFTDSDFGARLNDDLVMVSHPWLQYYVAAASFSLLGETALAARLPFALLGLATIAIVYFLILRVTANRWTAASAAVLLTLSVQFLLYARQSRYYSLNAALTCLLVWQFTRLSSWKSTILFAALGVLLFHSHPIALAPMLALGVLTFLYPPFFDKRRWFLRALPIVAVLTLPWFAFATQGYAENTGLLKNAGTFFPRLGQFAIEFASVTPIVGVLVLIAVIWRQRSALRTTATRKSTPASRRPARQSTSSLSTPDERGLIVALAAITVTYGVAIALTQPRDTIWAIGMRYTPAVIPFMAMVSAIVIARASRGHWRPWVALVLVFGFTKIARVTPWTFWEEPRAQRDVAAAVTFHTPTRPIDRVLRTGQLAFLESLVQPNPGTTARIVEYLNTNATREDIVITNYEWEPLYFHTRLRQGMTVLPSYSIYGAAKAMGLPNYVFGSEGARWIIWRKAWSGYRGQRIDDVLAQFKTAQVPVSLVARIPETLWENRENIHFRRFAGNRYIYPWFGDVPETLIYRVDQPVSPNVGGN